MEQNTGTLGHFLPGILFTFWGILTVLGAWKNYYRSTVQSSCKYRTTCHPIPFEKALTLGKKMVRAFFLAAPVIGMLGEAITGTMNGWTYNDIQNNVQHIVMFASFAVHLGFDFWMPSNFQGSLTRESINYFTLIIAFGTEGYLFSSHLHQKTHLDRKLHVCLTFAILINAVAVMVEAVMSKSKVLPVIIRGCTTAWQGTWFVHIAIVSWPLPLIGNALVWTSVDLHANAMLTDAIFIGYLLFIIPLALMSGQLVGYRVKQHSQNTQHFRMNSYQKTMPMDNNQKDEISEQYGLMSQMEEETETA